MTSIPLLQSAAAASNAWITIDAGKTSRRNNILLQVTCVFWLLAKIIGWKVWVSNRLFPVIPPLDFLLSVPGWAHWTLLTVSIALLCMLILKPASQPVQIALLVSELCSCLLDQNRWQPWEYQYVFILFTFIINYKKTQHIIPCIAVIMISIYFYSGVSKINEGFLYVVWDRMILQKLFNIHGAFAQYPFLYKMGYFIGVLEIMGAVGLLINKTRKPAAICLAVLHVTILFFIGPFGIYYNLAVWPWNVLMMLFLWLTFIDNKKVKFDFGSLTKNRNILLLICWCILPAFSYAGCWDNYLSARLYAGNLPNAAFHISDSSEKKLLLPYVDKKIKAPGADSTLVVNLQTWAMNEMNVPPYPELRVYKKVIHLWLLQHPGSQTKIVLYRFTGRKKTERLQ